MKLPKADSLILFVFLGCVALWAISKCSARRSSMLDRLNEQGEEERDERPARRDTITPSPIPTAEPKALIPQPPPLGQASSGTDQPTNKPLRPVPTAEPTPIVSTPAKPSNTPKGTAAATTKPKENNAVLYVSIDGLKLRKQPSLKSEVVTNLELYEAVDFLGKKSEKPEEISLGYEKVTDYWVKVRNKSGKEGWVFGAGVHYYKMKRKGVME
jgi:Bacterial SH3 domain